METLTIQTSMEPMVANLEQARKIIGISRTTLYRLIRDGKIPVVTIYGKKCIQLDDLRAFVEQSKVSKPYATCEN